VTGFFVGVDLGQARDYSAIVIVELVEIVTEAPPPKRRRNFLHYVPTPQAPTIEKRYHVTHVERPRLGTSYPAIVRRVAHLLEEIGEPAELIIDGTGVGRAVLDIFEAANIYPLAITITAGDTVVENGSRGCRVPKRDLVSTIEVLLQEGKLKIAQNMSDRAVLVDELLNFRAGISASGRDTYAAAGSAHDDFVMSLGLCCWRARQSERQSQREPVVGTSEFTALDIDEPNWMGDPSLRYIGGYSGSRRHIHGVSGITPASRHLRWGAR
jgi:hypothetical protein